MNVEGEIKQHTRSILTDVVAAVVGCTITIDKAGLPIETG